MNEWLSYDFSETPRLSACHLFAEPPHATRFAGFKTGNPNSAFRRKQRRYAERHGLNLHEITVEGLARDGSWVPVPHRRLRIKE